MLPGRQPVSESAFKNLPEPKKEITMPSSQSSKNQIGLKSLNFDDNSMRAATNSNDDKSDLKSLREDSKAAPIDMIDDILPAKNQFKFVPPF